jgi:hypothetical protein
MQKETTCISREQDLLQKTKFHFLFEPATLRLLLNVSLIGWYWLAISCQQLQPKALPG